MFAHARWQPGATKQLRQQVSAQHSLVNLQYVRPNSDINNRVCVHAKLAGEWGSLPSRCRRGCGRAASLRIDNFANRKHLNGQFLRSLCIPAAQAVGGDPDGHRWTGPSHSQWRRPRTPSRGSTGHAHQPHPASAPPWLTPHPPLEARALLTALLNCHDLDALLLTLRIHEKCLNVRHLDVALDRLGRLTAAAAADGGSDGAVATGAASATARATGARLLSSVLPAAAATLTPRDCASLLSALARLELRPLPEAAELLQGRLLAQLGRASVRDVAQALHASARLRLALPAEAVWELLRRLDGELAAAGKPQDVSMVLWSLATLELSPAPLEWVRRLLGQLPPHRLATFQPQSLSNTAWALARLGCRPGVVWRGALVEASGRMLESFHTPELVNLLWALAEMRHAPPPTWTARALGLLRDRAASMNTQDVSSLCWSLAVLRLRPGLPLLQRLVARALALRRQMSPQSLVTTLWGLSRLGVQIPERAVALLLQGGLGAAALYGPPSGAAGGGGGGGGGGHRRRVGAAAVATVGPGDLAGAALVLSYCRHVPPRRWLVRYCAAVARQLHAFGPRELSTLLYGVGRLGPMGLRLDSHWLDRVLAEVERMSAPPPSLPPLPPALSPRLSREGERAEQPPQPPPQQDQPQPKPKPQPQPGKTQPPPRPQDPRERREGVGVLDPAQLTVVLWAVARLGHRPPAAWVAAMARRVAQRTREFAPREAAATIRALQELAAAVTTTTRRTHVVPISIVTTSSSRDRSRSRGGRRSSSRRRGSGGGLSSDCGSSSWSGGNSSSGSGGDNSRGAGRTRDACCEEAVAELLARLAGDLPERSLYGALRSASLSRGVMSYATVADQLLTDVYSVKSLGLIQGNSGLDFNGGGGGGDLFDVTHAAAEAGGRGPLPSTDTGSESVHLEGSEGRGG